jgi:hypothetical protein
MKRSLIDVKLSFICSQSQHIQQAVPIFHHQTANSSLSQVLKQFSAVNPINQQSSQTSTPTLTPSTTLTTIPVSGPKSTPTPKLLDSPAPATSAQTNASSNQPN